MKTFAIIAVFAYLCGSIPFGYILVKLFLKKDVRQTGSGNIGATNVARTGAKGLAILTLLLDAVKGFVAVMFSMLYVAHVAAPANVDRRIIPAFAGLFAILGHLYPVWLKFKGGKGVATALGVFLGLAPTPVGIVLGVFALVVLFTRYISLGSILAAAAFPFAVYLTSRDQLPRDAYILIALCSLLIIWRHRANIQRLFNGTENRFPAKKQTEGNA
ncbi:MAG TPA: glycerol-3-phosphate 1-O-acyltransferase PlsY [Candidatus Koribacter sp.]|jgi:glycerol-3-phosphate acyltransferase PlsY